MKPVVKSLIGALIIDVFFILPNLIRLIIRMHKGSVPQNAGIYGVLLFVGLIILNHLFFHIAVKNSELKKQLNEMKNNQIESQQEADE